jgi:tight adherence protein C
MLDNLSNVTLIIPLAAFFVIFLLCLGIMLLLRDKIKKKQLVQKIQNRGSNWDLNDDNIYESAEYGKSSTKMASFFNQIGKWILPSKSLEYSNKRTKFLRAGFRRSDIISIYWGVKIFFAVLFPLFFILLHVTFFKLIDTPKLILFTFFSALFGFYLANIFLFIKSDIRKDNIRKALPDALDLMVVCVEAGMGLDAAIFRVGVEIQMAHPVLSDELKQVNLELRAGKLRADALRNLGVRTGVDDVKSLVALLIQTDKFGTSVAQSLRIFSDTFRTKRFQVAEEKAAKIPVKLVIPLILFIFPSLMVVLMGPAVIRIYQNMIMR